MPKHCTALRKDGLGIGNFFDGGRLTKLFRSRWGDQFNPSTWRNDVKQSATVYRSFSEASPNTNRWPLWNVSIVSIPGRLRRIIAP